jgi:hypothetical protein
MQIHSIFSIKWNLISKKLIHYFHCFIVIGNAEQCKAQVMWWGGKGRNEKGVSGE